MLKVLLWKHSFMWGPSEFCWVVDFTLSFFSVCIKLDTLKCYHLVSPLLFINVKIKVVFIVDLYFFKQLNNFFLHGMFPYSFLRNTPNSDGILAKLWGCGSREVLTARWECRASAEPWPTRVILAFRIASSPRKGRDNMEGNTCRVGIFSP